MLELDRLGVCGRVQCHDPPAGSALIAVGDVSGDQPVGGR
jgi:hypothetical protein